MICDRLFALEQKHSCILSVEDCLSWLTFDNALLAYAKPEWQLTCESDEQIRGSLLAQDLDFGSSHFSSSIAPFSIGLGWQGFGCASVRQKHVRQRGSTALNCCDHDLSLVSRAPSTFWFLIVGESCKHNRAQLDAAASCRHGLAQEQLRISSQAHQHAELLP